LPSVKNMNQKWEFVNKFNYYFRYEANRLASLLAATINEPSLWGSVDALKRCMDLASDGFYYLGPGDKVRCEFCRLEVCEWTTDDTVHGEHMKFNSKCPLHSVGGGCTGNVRIGEEQMNECKIDAIPFAGVESKMIFYVILIKIQEYTFLMKV